MVEHINESTWSSFRTRLRTALPLLLPRPTSGIRWLDVFYVVLIAVVQFNVVPDMGLSWFRVDLLTPWIVATAILQSYSMALTIGVVAALLIEGRTVIPAGTMICTYAIVINIIYICRDLISWRRQEPWLTAMAAGVAWSIGFEMFVETMENTSFSLTLRTGINIACRFGCSMAFGLILIHWALRYLENELADL